MSDDSTPAFPSTVAGVDWPGLTKRELFAAMVCSALHAQEGSVDYVEAAIFAVKQADALLMELAKEPTK